MNKLIYILILLSLISCKQGKTIENTANSNKEKFATKKRLEVKLKNNKKELEKKVIPQKIVKQEKVKQKNEKVIFPDFFKIKKSQFNQFESDNSKWFIGTDGRTRLYFVPYTDYLITTAILIEEEIKDLELIKLLKSEGIHFTDFNKTIKIGNIKSDKGIELGLSLKEVINIFGIPNIEKERNKEKKLIWNFKMLEKDANSKIGGLKPYVLEGLEFIVEMTFINEKRTKVVYEYGVP